jgi:exonuclease SbcC
MQPLQLTLKGFRGIRDGLGRDEVTLDLERLADGAHLIAIVGANGSGKSTIMDCLTPFIGLPSRAALAGAGGFSYYDHVYLPESVKDLTWAHEGRCYRSQIVIRLSGRRRTEAFLHTLDDAGRLAAGATRRRHGVRRPGRDVYARCVESICGSAETFFTSVFAAQGKRQLSTYRNAEIKTLLADLLGQEEIQALGQKAAETVRLLKAGLATLRQELAGLDAEGVSAWTRHAESLTARAIACPRPSVRRLRRRPHWRPRRRGTRAWRSSASSREPPMPAAHSSRPNGSPRWTQRGTGAAARSMARDQAERQRLERLDQRVAGRRLQQERSAAAGLDPIPAALPGGARRGRSRAYSVRTGACRWRSACRRCAARCTEACREQTHELTRCQGAVRLAEQRVAGIEQEAGRAALKAEELARRFGLTGEVPCVGTDLQGRCKLLGDAREAQALIPNAQAQVARLAGEKAEAQQELIAARQRCEALAGAPQNLARAEPRSRRARAGESPGRDVLEGAGVRTGTDDIGRDRAGVAGAGA